MHASVNGTVIAGDIRFLIAFGDERYLMFIDGKASGWQESYWNICDAQLYRRSCKLHTLESDIAAAEMYHYATKNES